MHESFNVLIVDDTPYNITSLKKIIKNISLIENIDEAINGA